MNNIDALKLIRGIAQAQLPDYDTKQAMIKMATEPEPTAPTAVGEHARIRWNKNHLELRFVNILTAIRRLIDDNNIAQY